MSCLFDMLPLYATDAELAVAILGKRSKDWAFFVALYEGKGLPRVNTLTSGRYVPAVRRFLDLLEGLDNVTAPRSIPATMTAEQQKAEAAAWNARRPRRQTIKT